MSEPAEKKRKVYALLPEGTAKKLETIAEREFRTLTAQVAWVLQQFVDAEPESESEKTQQ